MEVSSTISLLLSFTKYLGIFLSAASGILGLLVEFKEEYTDEQGNKHKRVTRWGKIALAGILFGALLSTASEFLTTLKSRVSAAEELARANKVLNEINRSINLLQNPMVSWEFELPLDDPSLSSFREAVEKTVSEIKATPEGHNDCGGYYRYDDASHPRTIRFWSECRVIPSFDGTAVGNLLNSFGLSVRLLRLGPGEKASEVPSGPADMSFQVSASKKSQPVSPGVDIQGRPNYHFEYELKEKKLMLCGDDVAPADWLSNNKILSLVDLPRAQMWVSQTYVVFNQSELAQKDVYDRLRRQLTLRSMTLRFDRQSFRLAGARFRVQTDDKGQPRYYTELPDSLEELRVGVRK
jgi:hypothetical protein